MSLKLISAPIRRINVGVQFLRIGDAHGGSVPFQKFAGETLGHATEQEGFRHRTLELKVGERRRRSPLHAASH